MTGHEIRSRDNCEPYVDRCALLGQWTSEIFPFFSCERARAWHGVELMKGPDSAEIVQLYWASWVLTLVWILQVVGICFSPLIVASVAIEFYGIRPWEGHLGFGCGRSVNSKGALN